MRREYPEAPIAAVAAIIVDREPDGSRRVLLIRRAREPQKGQWSLPGGAVELGETLDEALRREVREETGLEVEPIAVVEVLDRIVRDADGRVQYQYVLIDSLCRVSGGALCCATDATEARWVAESAFGAGRTVDEVTAKVVRKAFDAMRALEAARER